MEVTKEQLAALQRFQSQNGFTWLHVLVNMNLTGDLRRHPDGQLLTKLLVERGATGVAVLESHFRSE